MCNLVVPWGRANPDVFNALIPGVTIRGALRARALRAPRIISTHMPYRAGLPRVVYLVRDGRDALVSYYHYQIKRPGLPRQVSFQQFLAEHSGGQQGERWHDHVVHWVTAGRAELGDRLLVVRYEDLLAEPVAQMRALVRFLGIEASDESLEAALRGANLETMRRVEARRLPELVSEERSFYGRGRAAGGAGWFDDAMLDRFAEEATAALELCGYPVRPGRRA